MAKAYTPNPQCKVEVTDGSGRSRVMRNFCDWDMFLQIWGCWNLKALKVMKLILKHMQEQTGIPLGHDKWGNQICYVIYSMYSAVSNNTDNGVLGGSGYDVCKIMLDSLQLVYVYFRYDIE